MHFPITAKYPESYGDYDDDVVNRENCHRMPDALRVLRGIEVNLIRFNVESADNLAIYTQSTNLNFI